MIIEKIITKENFKGFEKQYLENKLSEDIVYIISNEVLLPILRIDQDQCGIITLEVIT